MGCGTSKSIETTRLINANNDYVVRIEKAWNLAKKTVKKVAKNNLVVDRSGWKTIRIFVSSTFKDFHSEREMLVKQVFPDLRSWCQSRMLHLIECDLRWGVPKDSTTEQTLRICLEEIDRCYQENVWPFFINMTSERTGWVPDDDLIPDYVRRQYEWIDGLSITEMEIIHAAYRIDNPNALFMLRDKEFLSGMPENVKGEFTDLESLEESNFKLNVLKDHIKKKFKRNVQIYNIKYSGLNEETKRVDFTGLEDFSKKVYDFFRKRIEIQYPMRKRAADIYERRKEEHEAFMKSKSQDVIGRNDLLNEINSYIINNNNNNTTNTNTPLLVLGNAGSGKSSILAKCADECAQKIRTGDIKPYKKKQWKVFSHFVGAVPGSTEIDDMLNRLIKEITGKKINENEKSNIVQVVSALLSNENVQPTVIIIDALNQFDEDSDAAKFVTWLPRNLSPSIRVIVSMIDDTPQALILKAREPLPKRLIVSELNNETRMEIVTTMLGKYNKRLDDGQMASLLEKNSSHNPLWLSIACEELRIFGQFRQISNKIRSLADSLLGLEEQVLKRFEDENGGDLLVATLCLIEVSGLGLLETELLSILAHDDYLKPCNEKEEKEASEKNTITYDRDKLPAIKWAEIYRALKPFIRPFGDSGEGRLDFYHRSVSKAVRKRYLYDEYDCEISSVVNWWHGILADFFLKTDNFERKIEELPRHLIKLKKDDTLKSFLCQWDVINALFDVMHSKKLIDYWTAGSSLKGMQNAYSNLAENIINDEKKNKDDWLAASRKLEKLGSLLAQGGEYKFSKSLVAKALEAASKGAANDEMLASLHFMNGFILDERLKLDNYVESSHTPIIKEIIASFEKAVDLWKNTKDKVLQHRMGRTLNRLSFHYSGLAENNPGLMNYFSQDEQNGQDAPPEVGGGQGLNDGSNNDSGGENLINTTNSTNLIKEKSIDRVNKAIEIFKHLDDKLMQGDCLTTRALCCKRGDIEQQDYYKQAMDILQEYGGETNLQMHRLILNFGIYYEDVRNYNKAYEFFRKWYLLGIELFGESHPKVKRAVETLNEYIYTRIARSKGDDIPQYFSANDQNEEEKN